MTPEANRIVGNVENCVFALCLQLFLGAFKNANVEIHFLPLCLKILLTNKSYPVLSHRPRVDFADLDGQLYFRRHFSPNSRTCLLQCIQKLEKLDEENIF